MNQTLDQDTEQMQSMRHKLTAAQSESEYYKSRYNDLCNTLSAEKHNLGSTAFLRYNSLLQRMDFSAVMY